MTTPSVDTNFTPDYRSASWRALLASGMWLRAGFVGASVFAIGVITLFSGEWSPATAFASALAGGVFAAYAWRRALLVIDRADGSEASPPAPTAAHVAGFRSRVEPTASR
ncbi:MAG: hypothetical protein ABI724_11105 [Betaproteobacteria bacterium]